MFHKEGVDAAIYEVGIGGAWDPMDVPGVAEIIALGLDHVTVLGEIIEQIAWH